MDHMDTDKNWHLKKELNIGHILTTLLLVLGIITWGNTMDQRVTKAETMIQNLDRMAVAGALDNREMRMELITEIRELRRDINILYQQQQRFIEDQNGRARQ
jgi:hypothetical protein